ncbi:MAG: ferredoxin domain-containing protein [Candidatus Bathyarchaeia archaeon]
MPIVSSQDSERDALTEAARLMLVSARTAPKSGGKDDVKTVLVTGLEKDRLAEEMELIGRERGSEGFMRDARNVRDSEVVVLIGVNGLNKFGLNCGGCGYESCAEFAKAVEKGKRGLDYKGPTCVFKALDLGIALGSAVKTASILNVDNRIMYRIGTAALRLGYIKETEANVVMGIPLSAKGKNIYFDR